MRLERCSLRWKHIRIGSRWRSKYIRRLWMIGIGPLSSNWCLNYSKLANIGSGKRIRKVLKKLICWNRLICYILILSRLDLMKTHLIIRYWMLLHLDLLKRKIRDLQSHPKRTSWIGLTTFKKVVKWLKQNRTRYNFSRPWKHINSPILNTSNKLFK